MANPPPDSSGDSATLAPVGVLAVQGDFANHELALAALGRPTRQLRKPADLEGLAGLVLPGGESTTMLKLLDQQGLTEPLAALLKTELPVLATCAGLILLAERVEPPQRCFAAMAVTVARNGYGRQIHSGTFPLSGDSIPTGGERAGSEPADSQGVFIRAPRVVAVGDGVEVLARRGADPVLLRSGSILATCFHPELVADHFVTRMFVSAVDAYGSQSMSSADVS